VVVSSSLAREKSYVILSGLERSLTENINRNFDLSSQTFLNEDEQSRALQRLREDQADTNIELADLAVEELLPYLDLGDLVNLLNRHARYARNVLPEHISAATKLILKLKALTIRKRVMHPVRPLEVDDFPKLLKLAIEIQKVAPSLAWDPLAINLRRLSRESGLVDISIPSFWVEEAPVIHNLPPAEFDDTGFIGRTRERKELRRLLESDHRVVTIVGSAGIGKTALVLRVCNDLLEDPKSIFERIVWVTLKTRRLTAEGIRQVNEAIDSLGALIDSILRSLKVTTQANWVTVLDQLGASKILLVIDNLETLGEEVRELVLNIPAKSKVLFTSRVGLGEIEIRYELSGFAPQDAIALFRSLVAIHNCSLFKSLSQDMANRYISTLGYNPLLIKWFVLAVSKGASPEVLITKGGLDEPLLFFYDTIYERLNTPAKQILSILLASRRELTRAQLQDLTGMQYIPFAQAIQDLIRTSMVLRVSTPDGTMVFQVGQLVYEYLSRNYPPSDTLVKTVREHIKTWQIEQDKRATETARYRYGPFLLHAYKVDERIAAQHLLRTLKAMDYKDLETASAALSVAEQLTPAWWEVFRVKARLLEAQDRPIYEVEEAFEQSIRLDDNDVNRYHYATYLIRQNEYERALEQIEKAATNEAALPMTFKSLKGLTLMRMGKIPDAIAELQEVWSNRSKNLPVKVGLTQGTQLADAHRRQAEQMLSLGEHSEAMASCLQAAKIIDEAVEDYGYDRALVETAVEIVMCMAGHINQVGVVGQALKEVAQKWDANAEFRRHVVSVHKTLEHFRRNPDLVNLFPIISNELRSLGYVKRYTGKIQFVVTIEGYGFIICDDLGRVHFNKSSLVDQSIWPKLKAEAIVIFGVIVPKEESRLPHAVNLELDTATR
jgi:LuxR family glucitol operon transcriptional activator